MSETQMFERIRQLVCTADQMALDQYGRSPGSLKPDGSWVTPADGMIEGFLRRELTALFQGDVGIFGEEQGWSGNRSAAYIALLDPIDGTAAFRSRIPVWGISLAVFQQQARTDLWEPCIGIFSMPAAKHVFLSAHGKRAEWNAAPLTIPPVQPAIRKSDYLGSLIGRAALECESISRQDSELRRLRLRGHSGRHRRTPGKLPHPLPLL